MDDHSKNNDKFRYLKQAAEEKFSRSGKQEEHPKKFKPEDVNKLVREIKILQTALEIQAEELGRVQGELTGVYTDIVNFYENAPLGFVTVDVDGIIKTANDFLSSMLMMPKHEITGKLFEELLLPADTVNYNECLRKNYITGKAQSCYAGMTASGGTHLYAKLTVSDVNREFGRNSDYRIIIQDLSQQMKAELALGQYEAKLEKTIAERTSEIERINRFLEKEKSYAEKMSRMKTVFLANISHELRTPLVGILGYSEIMMNELKENEFVKMARRIHGSGTRLLETLNMILDFAKTETEKITLNIEPVNVSAIAEDVTELFRVMAEKKGLELKMKISPNPLTADTDERLFRQIVNNLVNNAVKYTNAGNVALSLKKEGGMLVLTVSDTGIGIAKERIDGIFEEFGQITEGYSKEYIGSGLGLTLVRRYADLLSGEVFVKSEFGKGSEFTVKLPLRKEKLPKQKPAAAALKKPQSGKVLIVEDDELNYSLLRNFIEDSFEVSVATNLENALNAAKQDKYDLILLDINLGTDETGVDVLREIRELQGYGRVPAIAVTAYSLKGDKDVFIKSGMNDYISKPFTKKELTRKINKLLGLK